MPIFTHISVTLGALFLFIGSAAAQELPTTAPVKATAGRDLKRREALKLYGFGLLCERENRLLEACRYFEEAVQLDPQSAALSRVLIPLYVTLERHGDALTACRKTLELDPGDYETWYLCARLHKEKGQVKESRAALAKALACPKIKNQPELVLHAASDLGLLCEEAKDLDGALAAYGEIAKVLEHPEALLELAPLTRKTINAKAAEVYEHMGELCLQGRRFDQAVQAYSKAQAKTEQDLLKDRLYYHLAKVHDAQEKHSEALDALDKYLKNAQPHGSEVYELKIKLLQQLGRQNEIVTQLKSYADRDQYNLALQLLVADRMTKEQHWTEAAQRYNKLIQDSPTPDVYRGLFALYQQQGGPRLRDILSTFDAALADAAPKNETGPGDATTAARARAMLAVLRDQPELIKALLPVAVQNLGGWRSSDTCRFLAVLAVRGHQFDAAETLYRQCLKNAPPATEHEVYDGLIRVLRRKRDYAGIDQVCREGLKKAQSTNRILFHYSRADALAHLGRYSDAIAEAEQAVAVSDDQRRFQMRLNRALILSQADQIEKAVAECLALLKETTQPAQIRDVRYYLSGIYSAAHKNDLAEEQLRLILQADPNDDSANNDLGYLMADRNKNLEESEKLVRKAIELNREQRRSASKVNADDDKDHAAYIDSLGWVLFRKGDLEGARQELERATALPDGEDPVIWDHLGDVYLRLGQTDQTKAAWEKAAKLYDVEKRRKLDEQYKELKHKLKLLK